MLLVLGLCSCAGWSEIRRARSADEQGDGKQAALASALAAQKNTTYQEEHLQLCRKHAVQGLARGDKLAADLNREIAHYQDLLTWPCPKEPVAQRLAIRTQERERLFMELAQIESRCTDDPERCLGELEGFEKKPSAKGTFFSRLQTTLRSASEAHAGSLLQQAAALRKKGRIGLCGLEATKAKTKGKDGEDLLGKMNDLVRRGVLVQETAHALGSWRTLLAAETASRTGSYDKADEVLAAYTSKVDSTQGPSAEQLAVCRQLVRKAWSDKVAKESVDASRKGLSGSALALAQEALHLGQDSKDKVSLEKTVQAKKGVLKKHLHQVGERARRSLPAAALAIQQANQILDGNPVDLAKVVQAAGLHRYPIALTLPADTGLSDQEVAARIGATLPQHVSLGQAADVKMLVSLKPPVFVVTSTKALVEKQNYLVRRRPMINQEWARYKMIDQQAEKTLQQSQPIVEQANQLLPEELQRLAKSKEVYDNLGEARRSLERQMDAETTTIRDLKRDSDRMRQGLETTKSLISYLESLRPTPATAVELKRQYVRLGEQRVRLRDCESELQGALHRLNNLRSQPPFQDQVDNAKKTMKSHTAEVQKLRSLIHTHSDLVAKAQQAQSQAQQALGNLPKYKYMDEFGTCSIPKRQINRKITLELKISLEEHLGQREAGNPAWWYEPPAEKIEVPEQVEEADGISCPCVPINVTDKGVPIPEAELDANAQCGGIPGYHRPEQKNLTWQDNLKAIAFSRLPETLAKLTPALFAQDADRYHHHSQDEGLNPLERLHHLTLAYANSSRLSKGKLELVESELRELGLDFNKGQLLYKNLDALLR